MGRKKLLTENLAEQRCEDTKQGTELGHTSTWRNGLAEQRCDDAKQGTEMGRAST